VIENGKENLSKQGYVNKGVRLIEEKKLKAAIELYKQAIEKFPTNLGFHCLLVSTCLQLDYKESKEEALSILKNKSTFFKQEVFLDKIKENKELIEFVKKSSELK